MADTDGPGHRYLSEPVTNTVVHASTPLEVSFSRCADQLRLAVRDDNPEHRHRHRRPSVLRTPTAVDCSLPRALLARQRDPAARRPRPRHVRHRNPLRAHHHGGPDRRRPTTAHARGHHAVRDRRRGPRARPRFQPRRPGSDRPLGRGYGGAATLLQTAIADAAGPNADVANSMLGVAFNLRHLRRRRPRRRRHQRRQRPCPPRHGGAGTHRTRHRRHCAHLNRSSDGITQQDTTEVCQACRTSATCFIDLRTGVWQGSVQVPGLSLSYAAAHAWVVWLSFGLRGPGTAGPGEAQEGFALLEVALPSRLDNQQSVRASEDSMSRARQRGW